MPIAIGVRDQRFGREGLRAFALILFFRCARQTCKTRSAGVGGLVHLFILPRRVGKKKFLYDHIPTTENYIHVIHILSVLGKKKWKYKARKSGGSLLEYSLFLPDYRQFKNPGEGSSSPPPPPHHHPPPRLPISRRVTWYSMLIFI